MENWSPEEEKIIKDMRNAFDATPAADDPLRFRKSLVKRI